MANKQVMAETFQKLYSPEGVADCDAIIANLKEIFGRMGIECQITSRVKAPISILRKFDSDEKYSNNWNSIKDLIGLMVVVDTNQDIDNILYYVEEELSELQNPNSELLYRDYRKENYRGKNGFSDDSQGRIEMPSIKGYQTSNGYKNVRINLMDMGYPIEIQLKTKEQYIAHVATHDPVYKSPKLQSKEEETLIAGALFPYFEAISHLELHRHEMTEKQIKRCVDEIGEIYARNEALFNQYREIYIDACRIYAVHMFILKNQKSINEEQTLSSSIINMKLLESEILRVFNYKEKELGLKDPSLTASDKFNRTISSIISMPYSDFNEIRMQIAGSHRMENCAVIGLFDLITNEEIDIINSFMKSYRNVEVAIYDDELARLIYGDTVMFDFEDRKRMVESIKGVSTVTKVGVDGQVELVVSIAPMLVAEPPKKKYKVGFLPGVFDMLHPGHREYIEQVCSICDKVIIGAKSDEYVINRKGKQPVLNETLRLPVLKSIRGVEDVILTDYDLALPKEVRDYILSVVASGEKCAIFAGADWVLKPDAKGKESSEELEALTGYSSFAEMGMENLRELYLDGKLEIPTVYQNLVIACLPRMKKQEEDKSEIKSSSGYRKKGLYSRDFVVKQNEVITLGE